MGIATGKLGYLAYQPTTFRVSLHYYRVGMFHAILLAAIIAQAAHMQGSLQGALLKYDLLMWRASRREGIKPSLLSLHVVV